MPISLVILNPGSAEGITVSVCHSPFVIGRHPECHLRPNDRKVSARHCALLLDGDRVLVRDLGSTNGTYVNGKASLEERELTHGDILRVGPVHFQFRHTAGGARPSLEAVPTIAPSETTKFSTLSGLLDPSSLVTDLPPSTAWQRPRVLRDVRFDEPEPEKQKRGGPTKPD
jgi:pSer/pThr/pTyr-binding forkhead associated (FHA) protein